jgi:hypothetical protein
MKEEIRILKDLQDIIGVHGLVKRRPKQTGSVGGDSQKAFAYEIDFIDWEEQNHKNRAGMTLDNQDYWMPIIRKRFNVMESYWNNSNGAVIWIFKS